MLTPRPLKAEARNALRVPGAAAFSVRRKPDPYIAPKRQRNPTDCRKTGKYHELSCNFHRNQVSSSRIGKAASASLSGVRPPYASGRRLWTEGRTGPVLEFWQSHLWLIPVCLLPLFFLSLYLILKRRRRRKDEEEVELRGKKTVAVISAEQKNPFTAYRKYALAGLQQIRVGWNPDNDIHYQDQPTREHYVSGRHCAIVNKNGNWELQDTSRNGAYINFQRVYGNTVLRYGDSIRIMRLNIIFLGNMLAVNECDGLDVKIPAVADPDSLASPGGGNGAQKILFHRSPRNLRKLHTDPIEIEPPPPRRKRRNSPSPCRLSRP